MNDQIISAAYATHVNKGAMALLIGSGVSRESQIPTGWEVMLDLIRQIGMIKGVNQIDDLEKWYREEFSNDPDYSDILERVSHSTEERVNILKPYIEPTEDELEEGVKTPSAAHHHIAKLIQEGYIRVVITTNFDRLLENALKELGVEPTVISNPNHVENVMPMIHSRITILKINGDYLDTKFLNLKSELSGYDERIEKVLMFVFENFGLITCGWSGKWDVALVSALKSANKFRFPSFFTHRNDAPTELKDLSSFRAGHLVQILSASHFFQELHENVTALENRKASHPLSEEIAIARVKKYVSRADLQIQLNDLVYEINSQTFSRIDFDPRFDHTVDGFKGRIGEYFEQMQLLCSVVAEGVYWSDQRHSQILLNLIQGSLDYAQKTNHGGYVDYIKMLYLPSLILRYVIGTACIGSNNIEVLRDLLKLQTIENTQKRNILEVTNPLHVVDRDILNKVLGQTYKTPMSQKLYEYLRPFFTKTMPSQTRFNECFDNYELLTGLIYQLNYENWQDYPLVGRFSHSNYAILEEMRNRSETDRDEYELIRSRIFPNYELFRRTFDSYLKIVQEEGRRRY